MLIDRSDDLIMVKIMAGQNECALMNNTLSKWRAGNIYAMVVWMQTIEWGWAATCATPLDVTRRKPRREHAPVKASEAKNGPRSETESPFAV